MFPSVRDDAVVLVFPTNSSAGVERHGQFCISFSFSPLD